MKVCVKEDGSKYAVKIVKVYDEEYRQIVSQEFYLLQSVSHPNIIKVQDMYYNEAKGTIYIVMELVESGMNLFDYVISK